MAKKKESKNRSVERKVYYYKVTCKCDGTDEPLNKLFDAYIKLYDYMTIMGIILRHAA